MSEDESDEECPICCHSVNEANSPCTEFLCFPCAHKICNVCYEKVEECPICRTGKDGESGTARQERRELEERAARMHIQPITASNTIVFFRGGDPPPEILNSLSTQTFRLSNLPPHLERIIPSILSGEANGIRRRSRRLATVGERQHVASVLRSSSSMHIEDVLSRLFPSRSEDS